MRVFTNERTNERSSTLATDTKKDPHNLDDAILPRETLTTVMQVATETMYQSSEVVTTGGASPTVTIMMLGGHTVTQLAAVNFIISLEKQQQPRCRKLRTDKPRITYGSAQKVAIHVFFTNERWHCAGTHRPPPSPPPPTLPQLQLPPPPQPQPQQLYLNKKLMS